MTTLIHADIFFFVTTIAVIVVAAVFAVVGFYFIGILKNVRDISDAVKEETNLIREDIHMAREDIKREGFKLKQLVSLFSRFSMKKTRSKK
jgi:uncharacterized protein YoxC